jgi:hypothetical protein
MLFALSLTALGCGTGLDLHPVRGKVLYDDGKPVTGGTVVCELIEGTPRRSANGAIQNDGSFELGMEREGDGVLVGRYRAAVLPPALSEEESQRQPTPIHPRYQDPATAGLEFEIRPGMNEVVLNVSH